MYISSGFFGILLKHFEHIKVDTLKIFAEFETDIKILESPLTRMNVGILGRYLEQIVSKTNNPRIGLEMGFAIPFMVARIIFNNCKDYKTLRELFDAKFDLSYPIVNGIHEYLPKEEGEFFYYEISINSEFSETYPVAARLWLDMQYGLNCQYAYSITGRYIYPVLLHSIYPKDGEVDRLEEYFSCPVKFEQDKSALIFNKNVLDLPISLVNSRLLSFFEDYMKEIQIIEEQQKKWSCLVRRYILHSLSTSNLSLNILAEKLNMSRRNLHRKLKEEGMSYQQILDSLRMELSSKYLKEKIPLVEIAFLLGFESQSAFNKFFQKHFQIKPSQFR